MDVLVPPIPDDYDDYRATLKAFIAEHKPVLVWKQRTGVRVPDRADDVELLRGYARDLYDAGYRLDGFSTERGDAYEQRVLEQELGAAGVPHVLGNPLVAGALKHFGTDDQRATYYPPMARGDHIWTQLFSEPDAGSDLTSLQTRATRVGDEYVVGARRCGARGRSGRTTATCWLAPSRWRVPAASPPSSSTCTAPASTSVPCVR
jgi:alkylation response protein AidB-like acyl-CoA dehydrogenase